MKFCKWRHALYNAWGDDPARAEKMPGKAYDFVCHCGHDPWDDIDLFIEIEGDEIHELS